ncbi:MAG: GntR family transcriptional regulator [Rhodospirillales bacterium]|nr:GntR family transcriptional regulator [Rhodospirillales bacterium]
MNAEETLTDQIRRMIEADIVSGALEPGSRLEETNLAQKYQVSRTPIREALLQLASLGFVEPRPRQGAAVARLTVAGMMQMFEVMADLESLSAELAARRMTDDERRQLVELHDTCRAVAKTGVPDSYYAANKRFHELIYTGSHNQFLEQTTRAIRNRVSPYRRLQLRVRGRLQRSLDEHDAVVQAILDGDGDRARRAMQGHVAIQGDVFMDFVASLPPAFLHTGSGV